MARTISVKPLLRIFRVNFVLRASLSAAAVTFTLSSEDQSQAKMTKTAVISILSLLLLPAALASNPFVSLGLNEDFVRLDRHAHDGRPECS